MTRGGAEKSEFNDEDDETEFVSKQMNMPKRDQEGTIMVKDGGDFDSDDEEIVKRNDFED